MVSYHTQDTDYKFKAKRLTSKWLKVLVEKEGRRLGAVSVIFCSDGYLLGMNRQYLGHDYYTDIITFDYCEGPVISGDLFISVDTVRENALFYGEQYDREMHRVIVHGVLHLIGYDDHTDKDRKQMRSKENEALALLDGMTEV